MIDIATFILTATAAAAAVLGLVVAYSNLRTRLRSELPTVTIYCSDIYKEHICIFFKMTPDSRNMHWEVIRVAVDKSRNSSCQLSPTTGEVMEWSDYYEYDQPVRKGELLLRRTGSEVWLSLVCRAPLRWWKRWQWWRHWEERSLLPTYYNPLMAFPLTMSSEK